jgi:hypothetical protein
MLMRLLWLLHGLKQCSLFFQLCPQQHNLLLRICHLLVALSQLACTATTKKGTTRRVSAMQQVSDVASLLIYTCSKRGMLAGRCARPAAIVHGLHNRTICAL